MQKTKFDRPNPFAGYGKITAGLLLLATLTVAGLILGQRTSEAADVVVYKSPTCGCCGKWVEYLENLKNADS